jgi:hypothetical protein
MYLAAMQGVQNQVILTIGGSKICMMREVFTGFPDTGHFSSFFLPEGVVAEIQTCNYGLSNHTLGCLPVRFFELRTSDYAGSL